MSELNAPYFQDPERAREYLEFIRWPNGPVCPHCGVVGDAYRIEGKGGAKGQKARPGLLACGSCRKQFSVTVGTLFADSKIPLHKWIQATFLLCSSKKGMSSHQLHRTLGVTYKTAWFMSHRIREAMRELHPPQLGGGGTVVEADETFVGGKRRPLHRKPDGTLKQRKRRAYHDKEKVFSLVERGGKVRSFHIPKVNAETLKPIIREQVKADTRIHTDEGSHYNWVGKEYAEHATVTHSLYEYVRGDVTTNAIENYFSILKRGLTGIYQHCAPRHLKRYVGEFDFRYNQRGVTDQERTQAALKGIEGKRLTYAQPSAAGA